MTLSEVDSLIAMAREHGVKRMRLGECDFEFFALDEASALESDGLELCPCGHHLVTEHNEVGCLRGCSHELCTSKAEA